MSLSLGYSSSQTNVTSNESLVFTLVWVVGGGTWATAFAFDSSSWATEVKDRLVVNVLEVLHIEWRMLGGVAAENVSKE